MNFVFCKSMLAGCKFPFLRHNLTFPSKVKLSNPQETFFDIQAQALAEKNWRVGIKEDWDLDN